MLKLYSLIFADEKIIPMEVFQIPNKTKTSIAKDKKSKNLDTKYYASVTELEMEMLSTKGYNISQKFGLLIESLNPPKDLLKRTLRQIEQFLELVYRFKGSETKEEVKHIERVVGVFRDKLY